MSTRDEILGRVRRAIGQASDASRLQNARARLEALPSHLVPSRVRGKSRTELADLFRQHLAGQSATVLSAPAFDDVPAVVARYLGSGTEARKVRVGSDPSLNALPWERERMISVAQGAAQASDPIGLSRAIAGIAETGTLMLYAGPDNPVTLAFLPETHVIVVRASDIVASYEDAIAVLRRTSGGTLPRTVNLVSGPSRTADIGGVIVMGAHGPRRLAVVMVGEP